jgi:hypothetical protein
MVAGIKLERWPPSNRNQWPPWIGIRSRGRAAWEFGHLRLEPLPQFRHQRFAFGLAQSKPGGRAFIADLRLNFIQRGNAPQRLGRDRRMGFGQVIEPAADMAPYVDGPLPARVLAVL